jgi:hypothetical protein
MTVIRETHTMMTRNGVQVGRLIDDEHSGDRARAMLAYAEANQENVSPGQRNGRFNQKHPAAESALHALKQENAALKNQINQLKDNFESVREAEDFMRISLNGCTIQDIWLRGRRKERRNDTIKYIDEHTNQFGNIILYKLDIPTLKQKFKERNL